MAFAISPKNGNPENGFSLGLSDIAFQPTEHIHYLTSGDNPMRTIHLNAPTNELESVVKCSASTMVVQEVIDWPQFFLC
jgi:hypothetical protein